MQCRVLKLALRWVSASPFTALSASGCVAMSYGVRNALLLNVAQFFVLFLNVCVSCMRAHYVVWCLSFYDV